jgi:hypothetical protein
MRGVRGEAGQALTLVALALPLFFTVAVFVVDGSQGFVFKRQMQTAADAASLAAVREVIPALDPSCSSGQPCFTGPRARVAAKAGEYAVSNGLSPSEAITAPAKPPCDVATPANCALPPCDAGHPTNCFTWPYPSDGGPGSPSRGKVEVRLRTTVTTFLTKVTGIAPGFLKAGARAVAGATGISQPHCVYTPPVAPPDVADNHLPDCPDIPGTFVPGTGGVGFAKSPSCVWENPDKSAISYSGAGGGTIGALRTNGGFTGSGNGKSVQSLALGRKGDSNGSNKFCDDSGPVTISNPPITGPFPFEDWPTPLPTIPTPGSGCTDLGSASISFTVAGHPPGVYCVTGTTATLTLSALDLSGGYTFFAPAIAVQGGTYKCYRLCAGLPGPTTDATLFYATTGGVTMNGSSPDITGNIFAPNGEIAFAGGGVSGGAGFLESWTLKIAGNFANYTGTGGSGGHVNGGNLGQRIDTIIGANISQSE